MRGVITEVSITEWDEAFPGIVVFYRQLSAKPRTFLELVYLFVRQPACV
jgi:hypothetical protein